MTDEEFKPCAAYYHEADYTELVIADRTSVLRPYAGPVELTYDIQTGVLIGVRIPGDVTRRKPRKERTG